MESSSETFCSICDVKQKGGRPKNKKSKCSGRLSSFSRHINTVDLIQQNFQLTSWGKMADFCCELTGADFISASAQLRNCRLRGGSWSIGDALSSQTKRSLVQCSPMPLSLFPWARNFTPIAPPLWCKTIIAICIYILDSAEKQLS